jgi:integrase
VAIEWKNETGLGAWTGEDLKDLIWLMVYTGYRISDATFFDITRLHNQIFIRAKKNGGEVFAYVPDWLRDRLLARAKRHGNRLFITDGPIGSRRLSSAKRSRMFGHQPFGSRASPASS